METVASWSLHADCGLGVWGLSHLLLESSKQHLSITNNHATASVHPSPFPSGVAVHGLHLEVTNVFLSHQANCSDSK
jgi:hypothetical protein